MMYWYGRFDKGVGRWGGRLGNPKRLFLADSLLFQKSDMYQVNLEETLTWSLHKFNSFLVCYPSPE